MTPRHGHGQDVVDENGIRQVAGCLPIDPINKRFLLVTSASNPGSWVIPKGGWEKDETQKQAAMRETWEEAGVKGTITRHVGVFAEKSRHGVKAHHWIYEMEIKEVTKKFPEQKKRERRWFTYNEAMLVVKAHYIKDAISLSSLSPLVHPENLEEKKKKKKKKKKEKKDGDEEDDSEDDGEEKKKKKKKNKDEDNEDDEENDEDDEEKKKKKKKNKKKDGSDEDENGGQEGNEDEEKEKKKKKKKNKDGEITELSEEEIAKLQFSKLGLESKTDVPELVGTETRK
ncbi:hypothetical protein G6F70_000922 [Rhizopus microsporus]|nr:hypothetical protein G6F71_000658 [Rhizopus microsporus]KAG1203925.1 hypothetical protein G6F70_000922 [Rhizopus microsporus]KAG1214700.1 hypothetical protein G6F69_001658 [Rhizopus microsporus]KAG1235854.1 hypothetical protein G6F67_002464 [Rhizopus microsporus]KAG1259719.1 hypothetical protein G6F68_007931 [Rhizopus microsporus]